MSTKNLAVSFKKFCPKCEYFQEETGVCKKFYFNVRDYPNRFQKKCNGSYFKEDRTKVVQEIDEIETTTPVENDTETVETSQVVAERMTLGDILFSFEGRLSRSDYWRRAFPILLPIGILVNIIMFFEFEATGSQGPFSIILGLISLWPSLAVLIKRLHDRDRSGWFILTILIPFLNIVFGIWLIIEVWFLEGTEGENRFGPKPIKVS